VVTRVGAAVYVINPNSNEKVTKAIDAAMAPFRASGGPPIACVTLVDGPPGIETQRDADTVIVPLLRQAASLEADAAAFVIACFSDPGVHALREQSARPVLGVAECGVLTALTMGQRFGVIAILESSVNRHLRYFGAMGVSSRLAAELPIGLRVAELADEDRTMARMVDAGRSLRDVHGADVVVMGCAGMASFRRPLEQALGIPVVDPTQAAVAMALGRVSVASD
jgi:Asp/Glu/hydantoin racemase